MSFKKFKLWFFPLKSVTVIIMVLLKVVQTCAIPCFFFWMSFFLMFLFFYIIDWVF